MSNIVLKSSHARKKPPPPRVHVCGEGRGHNGKVLHRVYDTNVIVFRTLKILTAVSSIDLSYSILVYE